MLFMIHYHYKNIFAAAITLCLIAHVAARHADVRFSLATTLHHITPYTIVHRRHKNINERHFFAAYHFTTIPPRPSMPVHSLLPRRCPLMPPPAAHAITAPLPCCSLFSAATIAAAVITPEVATRERCE